MEICLRAMYLCFCFAWAHNFCLSFLCAMCSHINCLVPTHLVYWFLVNFPHLSSLVTLLICSLYNLLVFVVLCQFVIKCFLFLCCLVLSCLVLSCPVLSCPAKPSLASCPVFPLRGNIFVAVLFYFLFIKIKPILLHNWVLTSSIHPTLTERTG